MPPSTHVEGAYSWECSPRDYEPAPFPVELYDLLTADRQSDHYAPVPEDEIVDDPVRKEAYASAVMDNVIAEFTAIQAGEGRNIGANTAGFTAGRLVRYCDFDREEAIAWLTEACREIEERDRNTNDPFEEPEWGWRLERALDDGYHNGLPLGPTGRPADTELDELAWLSLADYEPAPVDWMWGQRVPYGTYTVLSGRVDVGKSLFTMALAAAATTGRAMPFSGAIEPTDVLLLAFEDDVSNTLLPRLLANGGGSI